MSASFLALIEVFGVASLSLVGIGIGRFYHMKFGERTHGWLLGLGAGLGILGQSLSFLPGIPAGVPDLVFVPASVLLLVGVFWLWFVMMGSRR